jgi:glutamine cyclotransferase
MPCTSGYRRAVTVRHLYTNLTHYMDSPGKVQSVEGKRRSSPARRRRIPLFNLLILLAGLCVAGVALYWRMALSMRPPAAGLPAPPAARSAPPATPPLSPLNTARSAPPATLEELTTTVHLPLAAGPPAATLTPAVQYYTYTVVATYPHDPQAFTQGLVFDNGRLYEGTGLNGRSSLRRVDLETGGVLQQVDLADQYFGEGVTVFGEKLYQLTWRSQTGFVYDKTTFALQDEFTYPTEGWGITQDGQRLIMSDGTNRLRFWQPETLEEIGHIDVFDGGSPVARLNELEYIGGEVFANIWQTDRIARIDPETGRVTGWIDLAGLLTPQERAAADVLNGIAYLAEEDRLFVTGKLWPKLFEIRLVLQP